jgi:hypothetical protein
MVSFRKDTKCSGIFLMICDISPAGTGFIRKRQIISLSLYTKLTIMTGISYRPLSDMHSDGVYFDKDELLVLGDESLCQYSGLPSVQSYVKEEEEEMVIGHS